VSLAIDRLARERRLEAFGRACAVAGGEAHGAPGAKDRGRRSVGTCDAPTYAALHDLATRVFRGGERAA